MTYFPPNLSFLDVAQNASDAIYTNNRKITIGNNLKSIDGGAGSTWNIQCGTSAQSGTSSLVLPGGASDVTTYWVNASVGAVSIFLPAASANADKMYFFKKTDPTANAITINRSASPETIDGAATQTLSSQYAWISLQANAASGTWNIESTSTSTGAAPLTGNFAAVGSIGTLTNARLITAGKNVFVTDGGAGTTVTFEQEPITYSTSGPITLTATSNTFQVISTAGGSVVVNLPSAATASPKRFVIKKNTTDTNTVTINRNGSDLIDGATSYVLTVGYQAITLTADATNTSWWIS